MSSFPHVDLIARAARLMRERAQAASPGPWLVQQNGSILHSGPSTSSLNERLGTYVVASVGAYDLGLPSDADAQYIGSWHPAVALAVADWLDIGANPYACVDSAPMLAVARAYLGEADPQAVAPAVEPTPAPRRRLKACVENWPAASEGGYDPRCCRWPKNCSATVYDPTTVDDSLLE